MKRYGQIIRVKPEYEQRYKALHASPWPEVNATLKACHIQNYSIYLKEGYLFSYYEYTGNDYAADMKKMAADPKTQEWWKLTDCCQEPVSSARKNEWWSGMEEVFHLD